MGEPPLKRQKVPMSDVSLEEITLLHSQGIQDNNLFRLQIDQLLEETSVNEKYYSFLNKWFDDFCNLIRSFKNSRQFQLKNKNWVDEQNLKLPFKLYEDLPQLPGGTFTFTSPEQIEFIGSLPLKILSNQQMSADVALILPKSFMEHGDMTNGRWLIRRVLYLAWLGKMLTEQKSELFSSLQWNYHCNCPLRPMLQIIPNGKIGSKWCINLLPLPFEDYFQLTKVSPEKHNLNSSWFFKRTETGGKKGPPTPYHNWACGVDLVMLEHYSYIKDHLKYENIIQSIKLLKIWLTQRQLNKGEGSLSNHALTLYVLHLLKIQKISPQMSSFQIFRSVLLSLSTEKWFEPGPSLASKKKNLHCTTSEFFHIYYSVVFIDPTGFLNLTASTSREAILEVRHEASKAIEIIESSLSSSDKFDSLFIHKVEFHLNFDQQLYIKLNKKDILNILEKCEKPEDTLLDHLGDARGVSWQELCSILRKALGDRIILLAVKRSYIPSWSFGDSPQSLSSDLTLGFLLNPSTAFGLTTSIKISQLSDSKEFREFWGDICSLRQFKDSSFREAILWAEEGSPIGDRRGIPGKIASHILKRHFLLEEASLFYDVNSFVNILRRDYIKMDVKYGTGEKAATDAKNAYDSLGKKLRSLDLPLKISSVQSSSSIIRRSCVFPPFAKSVIPPAKGAFKKNMYVMLPPKDKMPHFRYAMKMMIFLEMSGKWPDDLSAIHAIKIEFLIKIASLLRLDGITCIVFSNYLTIIWEGYIFQIEVAHRREIYLRHIKAQESSEDNNQQQYTTSWELEKQIEVLPKIAMYLDNLSSDFPSYSVSVRLILRWMSAQMLLPHIPQIVVEFLVAYLFMKSAPYDPPSIPDIALLRFLSMVSTADFKRTPFIINLGNLFTSDEETKITEKFAQDRNGFPALFVCTPCEMKRGPSVSRPDAELQESSEILANLPSTFEWTSETVTSPILTRLKLLASAGLKYYHENMFKTFETLVLFRPPLDDYDVLIHMDPLKLSRRAEGIAWDKAMTVDKYVHSKGERMPTVSFDPAKCFLDDLRSSYDSHALFFHDEFGGQVIGVLWRPEALKVQDVKVNDICGHKFLGVTNTKQKSNVEAIIEDFYILGQGLVKKIVKK